MRTETPFYRRVASDFDIAVDLANIAFTTIEDNIYVVKHEYGTVAPQKEFTIRQENQIISADSDNIVYKLTMPLNHEYKHKTNAQKKADKMTKLTGRKYEAVEYVRKRKGQNETFYLVVMEAVNQNNGKGK